MRALHAEARWTTTDYLLAHVLDALLLANWLSYEQCKRKGARNPRPQPVPRPADHARAEKKRSPAPLVTGEVLAEWLEKVG